jgi:hypothetical protein
MSYFIRIICTKSRVITRRELANFIIEGAYFDNEPRFRPTPESTESADEAWGSLVVHYDPERRPIEFERNAADAVHRQEIEELLFILEVSKDTKIKRRIQEHLKDTKQIYAIEINPDGLTDDCWEMLDNVESFIAREVGGIIYTSDEGFYDENLQRIYRL